MTVVFDTTVIIDILRGHAGAVAYADSLTGVPACSEVTRVEVVRSLRSHERSATERLFATMRWRVLDETIARAAGNLGRLWRRSHPGISTVDLVIAATVHDLGAELATVNVKHFPMFKGLRPPYPP